MRTRAHSEPQEKQLRRSSRPQLKIIFVNETTVKPQQQQQQQWVINQLVYVCVCTLISSLTWLLSYFLLSPPGDSKRTHALATTHAVVVGVRWWRTLLFKSRKNLLLRLYPPPLQFVASDGRNSSERDFVFSSVFRLWPLCLASYSVCFNTQRLNIHDWWVTSLYICC